MKTTFTKKSIPLIAVLVVLLTACSNMLNEKSSDHKSNDPSILSAPASLELAPGNESLTVTWDAVEEAEEYRVWFSSANDLSTAEEFLDDADNTDTQCTITGLYNGLTYYVWVQAVNTALTSDYSDPGNTALAFAAPAITSITERDRRLIVTWDPVAGAETYEVFYGTGDNVDDAAVFDDADNTDTTCTITGLTNSTVYNIWVRPVNPGTVGPFSENEDGTPYPVVGDRRTYTAAEISFDMVFVPGLTFPTGLSNEENATVDHDYWMADTEITNELFAAILQWAYDDGKFNTNDNTAPNYLSAQTVNFRGQRLFNLAGDDRYLFITWNGNSFVIDSGKEYYPVTYMSWYGTLMVCDWLTEMAFGSANEAAHTWNDNGDEIWTYDETSADTSQKGFRIPENTEWELAARYLGTEAPTEEPLAGEVRTTVNNGITYYWTPGTYASGATDDYTNEEASNPVSWNHYNSLSLGGTDPDYGQHIVGTAGISMEGLETPPDPKSSLYPNALGIFDMSGNIIELCFTIVGVRCPALGGNWGAMDIEYIQIGNTSFRSPETAAVAAGFRVVMSE